MTTKIYPLDQPLNIRIVPPDERKPMDDLEWMLDRWGIQGKAVNAATLR
jgi:hypothetical protein